MENKISVIIPMYNSEKTIEAVLESVLSQTRFDYIKEIIIVDDGSKDNGYRVVESFIDKHNLSNAKLIKKDNGGASSARNLGMVISTAEYIAFLDSDDLWLPNKLEIQMDILNKNPDIMFLGCGYREGAFWIGFKRITSLYKASIHDICIKNFPVTPSVIFKKSALSVVGEFDEDQKYGEDINFFQRFAVSFNYYYLPQKLVEIGFQKAYFGETGLTSNIYEMHKGTLRNITQLKEAGHISVAFYALMRIFYQIKYGIRIMKRTYIKAVQKLK